MENLLSINGIGESLALKLVKQGITCKKDLYKKEIFESLPIATRHHLYYKPKLIPLDEGIKIINKLKTYFPKLQYAGSFRRKVDVSGDLDIIIFITKDQFIKTIDDNFKIYAIGDSKSSLIYIGYDYNVKVDFFFSKKEYLPTMLLYLTGSGKFNIVMRKKAKELGYVLNQYGLYKQGVRQKTKTEKDIFKILNMEYKKPEERIIK